MRRRPRSPLTRLFSAVGMALLIGAIAVAIGEWGAGLALRKLAGNRPSATTDDTVAAEGFRANGRDGQDLASPDPKVFVFGGEAVLGTGIADGDTLPAALEKTLRSGGKATVQVFNFGRAAGYSTPERILLEHFLTAGIKPDLAIFVDGPGDFANCAVAAAPPQQPDHPKLGDQLAARSNLIRLTRQMRGPAPGGRCSAEADSNRMVRRLETNRRIVAAMADKLGFKVLFATLPAVAADAAWGFPRLAEMRTAGLLTDADQLWLAEPPPADGSDHAPPAAGDNHAIAEAIGQRVLGGNLLP